MSDLTPRKPQHHRLRWPDSIVTLRADLLEAAISETIYIVGGAVRDAFMNLPVKDIDLATPDEAIRLARKIANLLDADIYVLDAERDVARVLLPTDDGQLIIDIAHFRGDDLLSDLHGRDFTLNAMAVNLLDDLEKLIDPLNGGRDAQGRILRHCTPQSLADDPLRVLRAVRQSVQFGLRIEPDTMKSIRANAPRVMETSMERVRDEFMKMLALRKPAQALRVLDAIGVLTQILPELLPLRELELPPPHALNAWKHAIETVDKLRHLLDTISYQRTDATAASFAMGMLAMQFDQYRDRLNAHIQRQWPDERQHEALLMLGALLHESGRASHIEDSGELSARIAATCAGRLCLSNSEKKSLALMIAHYATAQTLDVESRLELHRYWYPLAEHGLDALLLGLADYLATHGNMLVQDDWLVQVERGLMMIYTYFEQQSEIVAPAMPIDGKDLLETLKLSPGPVVGDLLTHIREAIVMQTVTNRDEALVAAQAYLADLQQLD